MENSARPIIIIKKKAGHGGHHGGAWKVAYADFVTAMMALFIVLWLLNTSQARERSHRRIFPRSFRHSQQNGQQERRRGRELHHHQR